jgi:DNA-binding NarL/FixJ family response regulator
MGGDKRVRVVIAGAHPIIRGVVRLSCAEESELEVVAETEDEAGLRVACREREPDVLVLDSELADVDGLEALARLREDRVDIPVLMLSYRTDGSSILAAFRLGVRGYLGKADGLRESGGAVCRIARGERVVPPELDEAAVAALGAFARQAREGSKVTAALTGRQIEILALVSQGLTMQQAATRLGISPRTVESHVRNLYRKLEVSSRVQAVAKAARLGLIDFG